VICCQARYFRGIYPKAHCQKSISLHNLHVLCLEDTLGLWCLTFPVVRKRRGFSPELPCATRSRANQEEISIIVFFFDMWQTQVDFSHLRQHLLDGNCVTVQSLLDWFEVDLGFTKLNFFRLMRVLSV